MAGIESSNDRKMERVPFLLLEKKKYRKYYQPKVLSIGPYYHDGMEFGFVEAFKPITVDWFVSDSDKGKELYYNNILEIITDIRNHYEWDSPIGTFLNSDDGLAEVMLRDAAFIIVYMEMAAAPAPDSSTLRNALIEHLGTLRVDMLVRDLFLLENQIPLRVIKLLITLKYGEGKYEELLHRFLNQTMYGENRTERKAMMKRREPLHLLEAIHSRMASDGSNAKKSRPRVCFKCRWFTAPAACCSGDNGWDPESGPRNANQGGWIHRLMKSVSCDKLAKKSNTKRPIHSFRTVTDLMAKGIYFRPSPTDSFNDVNFKSRYFYSTVELPELTVTIYTKEFLLNLVAYELSPNGPGDNVVASYISLIKSLIDRPEDVMGLIESKILYNRLGSNDDVLDVFKDIKIYMANNQKLFYELIQAYYDSRVKTWTAELIHTNFRSPWTSIAFLAAMALLAISAAQLYYAVHPN